MGYNKALYHLQKIAEAQKEKIANGEDTAFNVVEDADALQRRMKNLRKQYAKARKHEIEHHPERKMKNMGDRHRQPLKCIETGEVVHSMSILAREAGLSVATVSINIDRGKKIKGKTYVRINRKDEEAIRKGKQTE